MLKSLRKFTFPGLVIPVSAILVALFDFLMAFILFVPLLIFYRAIGFFSAIWSWPLAVSVCFIATLGPGTLLAALNVKYRDFRYVIPFLVQILFFLTPIIYPISILKYPILQHMYCAITDVCGHRTFQISIDMVPNSIQLF